MTLHIRPISKADIPFLKAVIDSTGLFPGEYLDDMVTEYFANQDSTDIWLTGLHEDQPIAIAYCAPERLSEGTYNLYLIAVHSDFQGKGIGARLLHHMEELLMSLQTRVLLVETSGLDEFELTRKFYDQCGFQREAVIRDFYREGEDKVVFWKKLNSTKKS